MSDDETVNLVLQLESLILDGEAVDVAYRERQLTFAYYDDDGPMYSCGDSKAGGEFLWGRSSVQLLEQLEEESMNPRFSADWMEGEIANDDDNVAE